MKKFLSMFLVLLTLALPATAQINVAPVQWEPFTGSDPIDGTTLVGKGYARYTVAAVVTTLATAPTAGAAIHRLARHAIVTVETGSVRVRYDGTDPTATEGELWETGRSVKFEDQRSMLLALRMISTAGNATVTVTYGR